MLQHLWDLASKRSNLSHSVPARTHTHTRAFHTHAHGPAQPAAAARMWPRFVPFSTSQ
jgi:hypothetical protein